MKIVIVAGGTMTGPFTNTSDVEEWLDQHNLPTGGEEIKIFSMWDEDVPPATPQKAHSCGVLIGRNRPLENLRPDQRKAALLRAAGGVRNI